jgi:hypothetical protein
MATGDDALAAGMDIMDGTEQASDLDEWINDTRDEIARRTNDVTPISKGGTGAMSAAGARSALGLGNTSGPVPVANGGTGASNAASARSNLSTPETAVGGLKFTSPSFGVLRWEAPGVSGGTNFAPADVADGKVNKSGDTITGGLTVNGAFVNPHARANGVSGWLALGVNPSGQFGFQMSSRKFKRDIQDWTPDRQAILAMRLVQFYYLSDEFDHGLIAEELHDLGLTWLVGYDPEGQPLTVRYERIGLALLSVVQDHEARISALEPAPDPEPDPESEPDPEGE